MKTNAFRLLPLLPLMLGSAFAGSIVDFGARTTEPDPVLAKQFNLPEDTGHVIAEVFPGSPAAQLGLAKDDLVLSIDGMPASNIVSLAELVAATRTPGKEIEVAWSHAGQRSTAKVNLGEGCDRKAFTARYQEMPEMDIGKQVSQALSLNLGSLGGGGKAGFSASVVVMDGEHSISTSAGEGDKKKIKVTRTKDKEVLFDDEISESEVDTKVPEEIREKVRKAMKTGGLGGNIRLLNMGAGGTAEGGDNSNKPEHDVSDLLKKLEAEKAAGPEDKPAK